MERTLYKLATSIMDLTRSSLHSSRDIRVTQDGIPESRIVTQFSRRRVGNHVVAAEAEIPVAAKTGLAECHLPSGSCKGDPARHQTQLQQP